MLVTLCVRMSVFVALTYAIHNNDRTAQSKGLTPNPAELLVSSVFSESYKGSSKIIKSGKAGYLEDCNTE